MRTGFVIVAIEWEYNDNYYYTLNDAGNPISCFMSRKKAEKHCLEKNIQWVKETGLSNYLGENEMEAYFDEKWLKSKCSPMTWNSQEVVEKLINLIIKDDEELRKAIPFIKIQGYVVKEVEMYE